MSRRRKGWRKRLPSPLPGLSSPPGAPISWSVSGGRFADLLMHSPALLWRGLSFLFFLIVFRKPVAAGRHLRYLTEGLGGLWVPFAHLLGRQPVEMGLPFCREVLQARHAPASIDFEDVGRRVEAELGGPLEERFAAFDPEPFASIPFACAFRARIRRKGREIDVTVRILEPGVAGRLAADMARIRLVFRLVGSMVGLPASHVGDMLAELDHIRIELSDYRYELSHLEHLGKNLRGHGIHVLSPYKRWCGPSILTCEYVEAPSLDDLREVMTGDDPAVRHWLIENGIDLRQVGRRLFASYLRQVCEEDEFDRNVGPRHVLLLRDSRLVIVGTRSARVLHRTLRNVYTMFLRSLVSGRYDKAADCLLLLCDSLPAIDVNRVKTDLIGILRAYVARASLRPSTHDEKSFFVLLDDLMKTLEFHRIFVNWQVFDIHRGWAHLDECLAILETRDNWLREIGRYLDGAEKRQAARRAREGLPAAAQRALNGFSEFALFQSADMRRRARRFQSVVGKGASFFATLFNAARWLVALAGLGCVFLFLHLQFPDRMPQLGQEEFLHHELLESLTGELMAVAVIALLAVAATLGRFVRNLREPERIEAGRR